jgi:sec-independent protein translocase protein TatC
LESQETFLSHLIELRQRVVWSLIAYAVACAPCLFFSAELYDLLAAPLLESLPEGSRMIATGVISPFLIPMKIGFFVAFVLALPVILYQAWAFVAPGLYAHEKRLALPIIVSSTVLFLVGVLFCYYWVFGKVFAFIASFAPKSITVAPDIEAYFNFVLGMFLAFGLAFEVPVVVVVLVLMGVVTVEQLREWRGYVLLGIAVVSAVVTPPDVVSMLSLMFPMYLLYEVGIIVSQFVGRKVPAGAVEPTEE